MWKFWCMALLILGSAGLFSSTGNSQEEKKERKGAPPEPGTVIPPFVREKMKLTDDQQRKLATLEFNMRTKLAGVLSEEQMKKFDETLKEGPPQGGKDKKGPPQGKEGGPPMAPSLLIPPFVEGKLQLTKDQQKKIAELDRSARTELFKILSDTQKKQFNELLKRGPGEMPGKGDNPGGRPPLQGSNEPERIPPPAAIGAATDGPGIQWFATWASGQGEAARTGRPILLVAAAPHCAGVCGTW
jgi:Spy/CpxP family protein refolding chaperone